MNRKDAKEEDGEQKPEVRELTLSVMRKELIGG